MAKKEPEPQQPPKAKEAKAGPSKKRKTEGECQPHVPVVNGSQVPGTSIFCVVRVPKVQPLARSLIHLFPCMLAYFHMFHVFRISISFWPRKRTDLLYLLNARDILLLP